MPSSPGPVTRATWTIRRRSPGCWRRSCSRSSSTTRATPPVPSTALPRYAGAGARPWQAQPEATRRSAQGVVLVHRDVGLLLQDVGLVGLPVADRPQRTAGLTRPRRQLLLERVGLRHAVAGGSGVAGDGYARRVQEGLLLRAVGVGRGTRIGHVVPLVVRWRSPSILPSRRTTRRRTSDAGDDHVTDRRPPCTIEAMEAAADYQYAPLRIPP